jgi:hypothetical protein
MTISFAESQGFADLENHIYTYLVTDLRNNTVLAEVPLQNVNYENKLSGVGDASGSVKINADTRQLKIRSTVLPGKTGLYILRDGKPVWGGIVWKQTYSPGSRTVNIAAKTFESYFDHRFQNQTKYWANEDQLNIARWLVQNNGSAAAILMDVSSATSTRYRERAMFYYEFKTTGNEFSDLANLIDGFDYNVVIGKDNTGALTRKLEFWYPEAGVSRQDTTLLFDYPGVVRDFTLDEDAEGGGNMVYAIGAGEGTEQVSTVSTDNDELSAGWPPLQTSRSYKTVVKPSTLKEHSDADLERLNIPMTVLSLEVRSNQDPVYGSYGLGDWARIRLEDDYLDPAVDMYARITAIKVSVDTKSGIENISITLGGKEMRVEDEGLSE